MQTKGILAQTVMAGMQCLKDNLQHQRNDYDVFFGQISDKAAVLSMVEEPTLPRPHKVPRRLQHGDATNFDSVDGGTPPRWPSTSLSRFQAYVSDKTNRFFFLKF